VVGIHPKGSIAPQVYSAPAMEHAPLRPVPTRPAGPIHPAAGGRAVAAALPDLDEREARALALVALAGRPRAEVESELGIGRDELAEALASARKVLRRTLQPLTASGWCERAERLISDRLDGQLEEPGAARLDVHLRNCPRCVEHERRLVQATDMLMAEAADDPVLQLQPPAAPVALTVIDAPKPDQPALPKPTRSRREQASGLAWGVLAAIAVILALASLALVVAGVLGANL
jgi:Putative zinc-finger